MILINVAEWCVNALVLGLAVFFWGLGVFVITMLLTLLKEWLKKYTKEQK